MSGLNGEHSSYKVKKHIVNVLNEIPDCVDQVYLVDDACLGQTGKWFLENIKGLPQSKITQVLFHRENQGVGGAVMTGYAAALKDQIDIAVKVDGDEQMNLRLLEKFIQPIANDSFDYTKGNRFYYPRALSKMPMIRLAGNAGLSFLNKLSSGYWHVMDPTNGYTALRLSLLPELSTEKISKRYFFESDMLFRFGLAQALVKDIPMVPKYEDEVSNLSVTNALFTFPGKHLKRFFKRIVYHISFVILVLEVFLLSWVFQNLVFGLTWGGLKWIEALQTSLPTPTGTLFLVALTTLIGFQSVIGFLLFDIQQSRFK
jgi:glycosyltransferase involved in cell wall biosynthesis